MNNNEDNAKLAKILKANKPRKFKSIAKLYDPLEDDAYLIKRANKTWKINEKFKDKDKRFFDRNFQMAFQPDYRIFSDQCKFEKLIKRVHRRFKYEEQLNLKYKEEEKFNEINKEHYEDMNHVFKSLKKYKMGGGETILAFTAPMALGVLTEIGCLSKTKILTYRQYIWGKYGNTDLKNVPEEQIRQNIYKKMIEDNEIDNDHIELPLYIEYAISQVKLKSQSIGYILIQRMFRHATAYKWDFQDLYKYVITDWCDVIY